MAVLISLFIFLILVEVSSAADMLQNQDFETPPTNVTAAAATADRILLSAEANSIPGWSFSGTVWYVTSGRNVSLPGDGHGIQLGMGGKINQTLKGDQLTPDYILTFTLAAQALSKDCSDSSVAAVNVSVGGRSRVFRFDGRFGREMWESHAYYIETWFTGGQVLNLEIASMVNSTNFSTCGPVVDTFIIQNIEDPIQYEGNYLVNGGFEVGPAFLKNSTEGVLIEAESDLDQLQSPLQQWNVIGTIKYIDSKHFAVPEGSSAIEIVSGNSGVSAIVSGLKKGDPFELEFTMGDARDSCIGDLILWVQTGTLVQNFTMRSTGTGVMRNFTVVFRVESGVVPISFMSYNESRTIGNTSCGPVIDNVILHASNVSNYQSRPKLYIMVVTFLVAFMIGRP